MRFLAKLISFLKEVRLEAKKVNWLTRREVLRYTVVVIIFALAVSIYLGALDFIFQAILVKL
ncbi:MAG: preprotein translocase subunit SecE [Candidatus Spechtbacterales bacterium]